MRTILHEADEAPGTTLSMLTWYKNSIEPKDASPIAWDREHLWPVSYGFPERGFCNYPDTDAHAIVAEDPRYNGARGNEPFGWCDDPAQCGAYDVGDHPGTPNRRGRGVWQVWPDRRGDVARALFYLDVRYDGSPHKESGCSEPDLVLTDSLELIQTSGGVNAAVAYMGLRSVLLAWHHGDPVDLRELTRNAIVESYQGNRNPFVDHPEWADEAECRLAMPSVVR